MSDTLKKKYYFSFGIDCAPGMPRPNVYAEAVFKHIGVEPFEAGSKVFGAWDWRSIELNLTEDEKDNLSKWMKSNMDDLYYKGAIRGAQWNFDVEPDGQIDTFDDMVAEMKRRGIDVKENDDGSISVPFVK